ncbi:CD109 antigen-like [Mizuhopecten yessoensis]|uniref:CD109 antigen n=1 Tax=Mizuhopecten yessoensis TaxID=6573 RepID=A0A210PNP8_MIZYE|nr:CD109 antigen-like [Mizuhopecten yessoensis]OWF38066.1 CD109 antigen [Mizuhopecten yessoensis]
MVFTLQPCLVVLLFATSFADDTYFILAPKTIQPGQPISVFVRIVNATGPVDIDLAVLDSMNGSIADVSDTVYAGIPEVLELKIPEDLPSGTYTLRSEGTGALEFIDSVRLTYSPKATSIFIQTDKAVYRPGELVRIRAVGIYSSLKVVRAPMNVTILDSRNNRLKQWISFIDPVSSIFKGEFQLNDFTSTGDWTISVEQLIEQQEKIFEVREFVLPRYEVNLILPSFAVAADDKFTGKVSAMYTFGRPVKGELVVILERTFPSEHQIELRFKDFNGEREFSTDMKHVTTFLSSYRVRVTATVIEGLTGDKISDTDEVRLYRFVEKVTFAEFLPHVYKPGLVYNGILRITQQDDTVLPNATKKVNITISYQKRMSPPPNPPRTGEETSPTVRFLPVPFPSTTITINSHILKDVPKSGIVPFDVTIPPEAAPDSSVSLSAKYESASAYFYLRRAISPSDTYLQVRLKSKLSGLKAGKRAKFSLKSTQKMSLVEFQILSKSVLVENGHVDGKRKKSATFSVKLTHLMAPRSTLIVYFVRPDGEVVTDSISINVDGLFRNDASLKFNKKKTKPNTRVQLKLKASPGSEMHVLAIDKRVLLLKKGNDITQDDVQDEIQLFNSQPIVPFFRFFRWFPIPNEGTDAATIFQNAGVVLMTDLTIYRTTFRVSLPIIMEAAAARSDQVTTSVRIRKRFPETWIWTSVLAGANGKASLSRKTPDSITTWVASMFATDTTTGLGVAPSTAELTVFLNEFLTVNTPRSAIRGEIIVVQVDFFNYGDKELEVVIILKKTNKFFFSDADGKSFTPNNPQFPNAWAKTVTVASDDIGSVFFPIVPLIIGDVKLTVLAKAKINGGNTLRDIDAIKKPIKVKAEGIRQSYSIPSLKVLNGGPPVTEIFNITLPEDHVSGSEYIEVSAIGDIMGPSLAGIEDLLQMSYGCGEQNLLNFVPNVFITQYLRATNRLTPEIKAKTEKLLAAGYQRELMFQHKDGSFSAFGESDRSGSTWLTAFVVKAFAQAEDDTTIDPRVMSHAIGFLLEQQSKDGSFHEPGIVLHKGMQGGSISSIRARTSFVLIALAEAKRMNFVDSLISAQVDDSMDDATAYITSGRVASFNNTYELGIAVYALTLAGADLNIIDDLFQELESRATVENGQKYWILPEDEAESVSPYKSSWQPPLTRSRALDIEVTAYIMLAFVEINDTTNGLQILKWLITQQNSRGGFISTQDTVVALQALASLAELVYEDNFSLSVTVSSAPGSFSHTFTVTNGNALVLQIQEIPYVQNFQELTVGASGLGLCLLEVSVFFNVEQELRVPAFDMNITLRNETLEGFRLDTCFRWLRDGRSTMILLNVGFPTGMEGDITSIGTSGAPTFKRAEQNVEDIDMYFDFVTDEATCVTIQVFRSSIVANAKEVPVTVSDYYETANRLTVFYKSKVSSNATPEDVCVDRDCF